MPSKLLPKHVWKNAIGDHRSQKGCILLLTQTVYINVLLKTVTVTLTAAREDVEIMFINGMDGYIISK